MIELNYTQQYKVDVFRTHNLCPTGIIKDNVILFDNFDGEDRLLPLTNVPGGCKLSQMTIFYNLQGVVSFNVNGKEVEVKTGQMLTTMPECIVEFTSGTEDVRYMMFVIYPKLLAKTLDDLNINYNLSEFILQYSVVSCNADYMRNIYHVYNQIKKELINPSNTYCEVFVRSYLNILFAKNLSRAEFVNKQQVDTTTSRQYDVFKNFMSALNEYSDTERTVNFYAKKLGISPKYLSFVTLQYSNKNASHWIDDYVVQKAKGLLTVQKYNIRQTSEALNFQSVSSFSRFFKRVTGQLPREYS